MREGIKDKGRLVHIQTAINAILSNKDLYKREDAIGNPVIFYGFVKLVENNRGGCIYAVEGIP